MKLLIYDKFLRVISNDMQFPKYVTHLTFDEKFNQKIRGIIPNTVTHLTFGEKFN